MIRFHKNKTLKLASLAIGIVILVYLISIGSEYVSINPNMGKLHQIEYVTGKTIKQITSEYPAKYVGVNGNGLQLYRFFEDDSLAAIYFGFKDGVCKMEVIIPRNNHVLETYIHYFNKHGMEYTQGDIFMPNGNAATPHKVLHVQGNWRIGTGDRLTNIFMVSGELDDQNEPKPVYLINTSMTLEEWLAK